MAEEITYIPYGQDEISQQDLMTSLANGVPGYLDSKRWAKKDKYRQAWLNAYQDIIKGGLVGASNSSGIWTIQHGGEPIDLNTKSNLDREMYQDAAYYIQQQMSRMTPRKKEEEAKKDNLDKYDFTSQFLPQIYNNRYGGNKDLFASEWENLDARGDNGLRGTDNRKAALIDELTKYKQNLLNNKGKYNFEGTAFKDENDVIGRIDEAIAAINSPDLTDDNPKLNALGLSYNSFFSNGGNDVYGTNKDGQQVTYQQYYEALGKQKEAEAKAKEEELKKRKQAAYNNTLFFNRVTNPKMMGQNAVALKEKYKDHNSLFNALQGYAQKDIRTLSPQEQSEVQGAYRYLANQPIDSATLKNLQSSSSGLYKGAAPNRFRKIKGIDNLVWDSVAGQVIQINTRQQQQAIQNQPTDLFKDTLTQDERNQKLREDYANRQNISESDILYLSSLVPDVISLFDEEPISAGAFGVAAAGMRHKALSSRPGGMSTEDKLWQALDYAGGAFSSMPFFGDAYVLGRIINTARKGATALLGMAGVVGVGKDVYNAISKLSSGEDLSMDEKIKIASSIPLIIQSYRTGRAWKQNQVTKAVNNGNTTKQGSVKATNGEIKGISEKTSKGLQEQFKKAGNDNTKKIEILKNNEEVVNLAKQQNIDLDKLVFETHLRNTSKSPFKTNKDVTIETTPSNSNVYRENYKKYLETLEQGNFWQRNKARGLKESEWFYNKTGGARKENPNGGFFNRLWNNTIGSNKSLDIVKKGETKSTTSTETPKPKENSSKSSETFNAKDSKINPSLLHNDAGVKNPKPLSESREATKQYREIMNNKFSNNELKSGEISIGGERVQVVKQSDGTFNIIHKGNIIGNHRNQVELQKQIRDLIKQSSIKQPATSKPKISAKEMGETLKKLKAKGWLKQGGTINTPIDNIIEDFFKNSNI